MLMPGQPLVVARSCAIHGGAEPASCQLFQPEIHTRASSGIGFSGGTAVAIYVWRRA